MLKKILKSVVVTSAVLGAVSFAQDPNLHIYLAYGQSNMSGQASITDSDRQTNPRFLVLRAGNHSNQKVGEFYPAAPPMGHSQSKVGIVDFFGRKMIKELPDSITVAVANVAIGGQSIDLFDKDRNAAYVQNAKNKNDTWWIQYLNEYGGDVHKRIVEMGKIAKQKGVIKGFLFHQGEADYQMKDWPERVKKVYDQFIEELELDPEKTPILLGELAPTGDLGWRNDAVKEAADLISNGYVISAQGCPAIKEPNYTLHFTRDGYQTLGERYAEKMLELLKAQEPAPDTSKKDSVVADSSKVVPSDSTSSDSTNAIHSSAVARAVESHLPRLFYDVREHSLFVRFKKNGVEHRYRLTGRKQ